MNNTSGGILRKFSRRSPRRSGALRIVGDGPRPEGSNPSVATGESQRRIETMSDEAFDVHVELRLWVPCRVTVRVNPDIDPEEGVEVDIKNIEVDQRGNVALGGYDPACLSDEEFEAIDEAAAKVLAAEKNDEW